MPDPKLDAMVEKYRALRDKKKEIEARHKEELAPINDMLARVDAWFLERLEQIGTDSAKTKHGTVYKTQKWSATVADWDAVLGHVIENRAWHILNRSVSMTACREAAEQDAPVPGVNLSAFVTVGVRKPETKGDN